MTFNYSPLILALLAVLSCGCKRHDSVAHDHAAEASPGISFQAKHGLLIPAATAEFIGLTVAEVEERIVASTFEFSAQVYRAAAESAAGAKGAGTLTNAFATSSISSTGTGILQEGQPVRVESDGAVLQGQVIAVRRNLEGVSSNSEIVLSIKDDSARLARGAFVSVSVPLKKERPVLSVPSSARLRTTEGDFIYTVSGEHFVRTPIKIGAANADFTEVTEGIYEGDRVVVAPVMSLWLAELQSIRGGKACADGH